jgi:hypothetical protein
VPVHVCLQERLRELSQDLLGPDRWDLGMLSSCDWMPKLLGLDKRTMLSHIVVRVMAREGLPLAKTVGLAW